MKITEITEFNMEIKKLRHVNQKNFGKRNNSTATVVAKYLFAKDLLSIYILISQ